MKKWLPNIAVILIKVFGIRLLPESIYLAIKQKRFSSYRYEVARGWDILANKMFEPALSKHLGPGFGADETISERMAYNKHHKLAYPKAAIWEARLNKIDKDHLDKIIKANLN